MLRRDGRTAYATCDFRNPQPATLAAHLALRIATCCSYNRQTPMNVRLSKTFHFEAAHDLPTFPTDHKCRRLHGHSFRFDVIVEGEVDPAKGYLIDYGDIKKAAEPIVKRLDHYYLNEVEGLSNPTSEVLAKWLFDRLKPALPQLSEIIVYETCTSRCEYRGA